MAGTSSATLTAAPPTSGTYRFDPATSSWSALAPLHDPRTAAIAVVMHDRIHIVGGKDRSGDTTRHDVFDRDQLLEPGRPHANCTRPHGVGGSPRQAPRRRWPTRSDHGARGVRPDDRRVDDRGAVATRTVVFRGRGPRRSARGVRWRRRCRVSCLRRRRGIRPGLEPLDLDSPVAGPGAGDRRSGGEQCDLPTRRRSE